MKHFRPDWVMNLLTLCALLLLAREAAAEERVPATTMADGKFVVEVDIAPGTYRAEGGNGCRHARLASLTEKEVIAASRENVVTIFPTDKGFVSDHCGKWTKISDAPKQPQNATTFTNGTFIVGTDIQPGTYRNSNPSGCYHARLSGFTGNDTISNGFESIVTILPSDKGFTANHCGVWNKISD